MKKKRPKASQKDKTEKIVSLDLKADSLDGVVLTTQKSTFFDWLKRWASSQSLWPLPFHTSCCGLEFMASQGPKFDLTGWGADLVRHAPAHSDLMIVAGSITLKEAPVVKRIYEQMPSPKWVLAMGACACSGGPFATYNVVQGVGQLLPVDVFIPGCPPTPEALILGLEQMKHKIRQGAQA